MLVQVIQPVRYRIENVRVLRIETDRAYRVPIPCNRRRIKNSCVLHVERNRAYQDFVPCCVRFTRKNESERFWMRIATHLADLSR
jgi:hypothetical protein